LAIERKGKPLRVIPLPEPSKMARLVTHEYLRGDPDDIVHCDWSAEGRPDLP